MKRRLFNACLLIGLTLFAAMTPVEARRGERADRHETSRQGKISLDEAVVRVRRDTGGRVLSAQGREERGRTTYRIKVLLPNGSVRVVNVDAQSGESN